MRANALHSASQAMLRGAFCLFAILLLNQCEERKATPSWADSAPVSPQKNEDEATLSEIPEVSKDAQVTTFMAYNLRNYLTTRRGNTDTATPKPEKEILALIDNIMRASPDVLGVCEIGTNSDLYDLQQRLASRGLHFPHTHLQGGSDPQRRLAILSKFPLTPHPTQRLTFQLDGKRHAMLRGILDVDIALPSGSTRFIGMHLKSKRPNKYWDQAEVRRREAGLVRTHIEKILRSAPPRLIVYGDCNDTKQSPTIRSLVGNRHQPTALIALDLRASDGSNWTQYWDYEDIYSRFDYIFVPQPMLRHIITENSKVLDIPCDDPASDHRPLIIEIR